MEVKPWLLSVRPTLGEFAPVFAEEEYFTTDDLRLIEGDDELEELLANPKLAGMKRPTKRALRAAIMELMSSGVQ